jgi:hypothetical protein
MDHRTAILDELRQATERLGGDGERIRTLPRAQIYSELEDLGADRLLLAFVRSWGSTMDDADVLRSLQEWNRNGDFKFFRITTTGARRE